MKLQSVFVAIGLIVAGALLGAMISSPVTAQSDSGTTSPPEREASGTDLLPPNPREPLQEQRPSYYYFDSVRTPADGDGLGDEAFSDDPMPGKFQMALERMNNSNRIVIVVCDTSTGRCWSGQVGSSNWRDMGLPSTAKAPPVRPMQSIPRSDAVEELQEQPRQTYVPIGPSLNSPPQR